MIQTIEGRPYLARDVLRRRVGLLDDAVQAVKDAYGAEDWADMVLVTGQPEFKMGDVLYVPEDLEAVEFALWEVVMMLAHCADQERDRLKALESERAA